MNTVLVTGGAGFIGSHLCERLLALDFKVINLDNFNNFYDPGIKRGNISAAQSSPGYLLIEGDIRDRNLLDTVFNQHNIDIIIHLAALAGVRKSIDDPLEYIDVDIKGTANLLESGKNKNIKKFVFASSSSVYGLNPVPFKEDACVFSQISPYAAAKQAGELFCHTYHYIYGIPVVCLRFFTVYGPRQRPEMAIYKFTELINKGMEISVYGDGTSSRDYTYIDDVADGIIASIDLKCGFEIFNLGNSYQVRLNHLIDLIGQSLGKPVYRNYLPMQPGDVGHTCADITKSAGMLQYTPKTGIEEGIGRFVSWYKKYK